MDGTARHLGTELGNVEEVYLVRHGESEGDVVRAAWAPAELDERYHRSVLETPHWLWRLSPAGEAQARAVGAWLDRSLYRPFVALTSPYLRALETSAFLDIEDARWMIEASLRERDWGSWDDQGPAARLRSELGRHEYPYLWHPPGGESIAMLADRVRTVLLRALSQPVKSVLIVSHMDTIVALRHLIEGVSPIDRGSIAWAPADNCEVFHYSRRSPRAAVVDESTLWFRRCTPWREEPAEPPMLLGAPELPDAGSLLSLVRRFRPVPGGPPTAAR